MENGLRNSGIDPIGKVPWGTHFCQFYEAGSDLLDVLVPYFKAGLEANEACMWVTADPVGVADARQAMSLAVSGVDRYLASGQLEIIPHSEWYLKDGCFDLHRVLNGWVTRLEQAVRRGYVGLRLTGNTAWLEKAGWSDFTEYEQAVDSTLGRYQMIALCTYMVEKCGVSEVADVISNHQFALIKRHAKWEIIESSERRRAEEDRDRLLKEAQHRAAELDAAYKELETFSYSVSHDLRSPLRHINGYSAVLVEDYGEKLDPQAREYLSHIRESTQTMAQLIDDLIELSRVTRAGMDRQSVNLSELARSIVASLNNEPGERRAEFVIAPDLVAEGDPRLLRLALGNLLDNAWKFTSKRDNARIEFCVTERDGQPAFCVKDNGAGFDMTYSNKLFTPFQRLHGVDEFSGTGIGLATVQRIVNRHGGRVWAEGTVNQGASFYFTLGI